MVLTSRSLRIFERYFRRPTCYVGVRSVTNKVLLKEETNTALLNSYNQDIVAGGVVPVFRRALLFPNQVALQDDFGIYTYAGLYQAAAELSMEISAKLLGESERTISYMCSNDASHVIAQWAIWMTGNIAVPLTPVHPPEMLKYFITDSMSQLIIASQQYEAVLRPLAQETSTPIIISSRDKEITAQLYQASSFMKLKPEDGIPEVGKTNDWYANNDALIIYTSGTTSKPKGVVWSHSMLSTQIAALHTAWQYTVNDVVLHTLPLHHIHGQLNSMLASLAAGARIRMLPTFAPHTVWARLLGMGEREEAKVTVFHGVPSMYSRLAAAHATMFAAPRMAQYVRDALSTRMRLMVAGSAALPDTLFHRWEEISGHRLLERYGMSEAGMALSNPYQPVSSRSVGCVGLPLPGIAARLAVGADSEPLVTVETDVPDVRITLNGVSIGPKDAFSDSKSSRWQEPVITRHQEPINDVYEGELLLKGPGIFSRYLNRQAELKSSDFTEDGWFKTGDLASFSDNRFRILGRISVDIIKTGGYKVSALQVESAALEHELVEDAAVLGVENEDLGESIAVIVVLKPKSKLTLKDLRLELGKKLAPYQLPKIMLVVDTMPRNVMGKLDKKEIRKIYGKDLVLKK